jgi:hypothetical protein
MRLTPFAALACAAALVSLEAQSPSTTRDSLALARQFTRWFYAAEWDSLLAYQPPEIRADTTLRPQLARRLDLLRSRGAVESEVLAERFVTRNGRPQYWRVARFTNFPEPLLLRWMISPRGHIVGMAIGALANAPPFDTAATPPPPEGAPR